VDRSFLRREWGAVSFVVTVFAGVIIVPLALILNNQSPHQPVSAASPTPTASASALPASAPPTASPTPSR
jgi:hypothetical protein